jgi:hypothetical protein
VGVGWGALLGGLLPNNAIVLLRATHADSGGKHVPFEIALTALAAQGKELSILHHPIPGGFDMH